MGWSDKKKRQWGEIHLTIYGRCLSSGPPSGASQSQDHKNQSSGSANRHPKRPSAPKKSKGKMMGCLKHNFEGGCPRTHAECHFDHVCWHCRSADHVGVVSKRPEARAEGFEGKRRRVTSLPPMESGRVVTVVVSLSMSYISLGNQFIYTH